MTTSVSSISTGNRRGSRHLSHSTVTSPLTVTSKVSKLAPFVIVTFATAIIQAINLSAAPLFGIMYGSRDKTGILRSLRESIRLAITALLICAVLVMATSVFWAKVYDMQGINAFYIGLATCMFIYLPLTAVVRITTQFFESLEKISSLI